jgi:hypothetical protein
LEHQLAAFAVQADGLIAELAHQEYRLPSGFVERQSQLVLSPSRFHGLAHLALDPEKTVCRHGVVDALVRAEVVVVVDKGR